MLTFLRQYFRVDAGLVDLISLIYNSSQGEVFFDGASSTSFPINIGVKQGCISSSPLFGLPRLLSCAKPARAMGVGSEVGICPRGHRAYY